MDEEKFHSIDLKHDDKDSVHSDKEENLDENEETTLITNIFGTKQECVMRCLRCSDEVGFAKFVIYNFKTFYFLENERKNITGLQFDISTFKQFYCYEQLQFWSNIEVFAEHL